MKMNVAFLDCRSHGDCAVITFTERRRKACIVVDGGEDKSSAAALSSYLQSEQISAIDLMVGTHIDSDHINGLKHFVQQQLKKKRSNKPHVAIKEFWGPLPSEERIPDVVGTDVPETGILDETITWRQYVIQSVRQNDDLFEALRELNVPICHPSRAAPPKVRFRSVKIELLGPDMQIPSDHIVKKALSLPPPTARGIRSLEDLRAAVSDHATAMAVQAKRNANNQSIVLRIRPATKVAAAKAWTFLLTGDAEEEAWEEMLSDPPTERRLPARVLKIPHHGSVRNGITPAGAAKVKPKYSVNSVGQKHGLPDEGTLELLDGLDSAILCTQRNASSSHKSACYSVPPADCPAKGRPATICFSLDTRTGKCRITPPGRKCRHDWRA